MKNESFTALVSAFSRAYHAEHNQIKIFDGVFFQYERLWTAD